MSEKEKLGRREFVRQSAGIGLGLIAAPAVFSTSRIFGANDRIPMGIIGSGGRGRNVMGIHKNFGAEFIAVCDIYEPNLYEGMKVAAPNAKRFTDYRELLDQKDLEAVLIATPEHQHGEQLIAAVQAGKDAYCEKPMSHSIEEGARIIKEVRKTDRIVQIGMQRRSSPVVHAAKKIVDDGILGKINLVKAYWNWNFSKPLDNSPLAAPVDWKKFIGPAPWHKMEPMRFRSWRFFWDYSGGNCTDQGTHLMDVVQWFMGEPCPVAATQYGSVYRMTGAETPDVFACTFEYRSFMATWTLCYTSSYQNGWTILFHGDKGTLEVDDDGFRVKGEPWKPESGYLHEMKGHLPSEPHVQNFLECARGRKEPNAPVEVGHLAVSGPHLANVAYHHKTRARLNEDATQVFV